MLLFGHTGITLGVAWLSEELFLRRASRRRLEEVEVPSGTALVSTNSDHRVNLKSWGRRAGFSRSKLVFYGLLLLGSMLPDIIDKPVGMWLWHDEFGNGRIFGHTLILSIIILAAGVSLRFKTKRDWVLVLTYGYLMHLLLDQMWRGPKTLFWPLYGWQFDKVYVPNWLAQMLYDLTHKPSTYVPEIVGLVILIAFLINMVRQIRKSRLYFRATNN